MTSYDRRFCTACKRYSTHEDGLCMGHQECVHCGRVMKVTDIKTEGVYRLAERVIYCNPCHDEVFGRAVGHA